MAVRFLWLCRSCRNASQPASAAAAVGTRRTTTAASCLETRRDRWWALFSQSFYKRRKKKQKQKKNGYQPKNNNKKKRLKTNVQISSIVHQTAKIADTSVIAGWCYFLSRGPYSSVCCFYAFCITTEDTDFWIWTDKNIQKERREETESSFFIQ